MDCLFRALVLLFHCGNVRPRPKLLLKPSYYPRAYAPVHSTAVHICISFTGCMHSYTGQFVLLAVCFSLSLSLSLSVRVCVCLSIPPDNHTNTTMYNTTPLMTVRCPDQCHWSSSVSGQRSVTQPRLHCSLLT